MLNKKIIISSAVSLVDKEPTSWNIDETRKLIVTMLEKLIDDSITINDYSFAFVCQFLDFIFECTDILEAPQRATLLYSASNDGRSYSSIFESLFIISHRNNLNEISEISMVPYETAFISCSINIDQENTGDEGYYLGELFRNVFLSTVREIMAYVIIRTMIKAAAPKSTFCAFVKLLKTPASYPENFPKREVTITYFDHLMDGITSSNGQNLGKEILDLYLEWWEEAKKRITFNARVEEKLRTTLPSRLSYYGAIPAANIIALIEKDIFPLINMSNYKFPENDKELVQKTILGLMYQITEGNNHDCSISLPGNQYIMTIRYISGTDEIKIDFKQQDSTSSNNKFLKRLKNI